MLHEMLSHRKVDTYVAEHVVVETKNGLNCQYYLVLVAAHLRGMRPTLTAKKATQCLEETQTLTELSI